MRHDRYAKTRSHLASLPLIRVCFNTALPTNQSPWATLCVCAFNITVCTVYVCVYSVCMCVCVCVCVCVCMHVCVYIYVCVCVCVCVSVCLSVFHTCIMFVYARIAKVEIRGIHSPLPLPVCIIHKPCTVMYICGSI